MNEKKPLICDEHKVTSEKIDRLENHFKVYKTDMQDVKNTLIDIKNSMIGSNLNGNKGFIHLLDEVDKRVERMEERQILFEEVFTSYKWSSRAFVGAIVSFLLWFFTKDKL